jgi:hypothetical protein
MKKTTRKLIVRRETVHVLKALDNRHLARVAGGDANAVGIETHADCPARAAQTTPG